MLTGTQSVFHIVSAHSLRLLHFWQAPVRGSGCVPWACRGSGAVGACCFTASLLLPSQWHPSGPGLHQEVELRAGCAKMNFQWLFKRKSKSFKWRRLHLLFAVCVLQGRCLSEANDEQCWSHFKKSLGIEKQLLCYMRGCAALLSAAWNVHVNGKRIHQCVDIFLSNHSFLKSSIAVSSAVASGNSLR